jgi:hypothetical protein
MCDFVCGGGEISCVWIHVRAGMETGMAETKGKFSVHSSPAPSVKTAFDWSPSPHSETVHLLLLEYSSPPKEHWQSTLGLTRHPPRSHQSPQMKAACRRVTAFQEYTQSSCACKLPSNQHCLASCQCHYYDHNFQDFWDTMKRTNLWIFVIKWVTKFRIKAQKTN